MPLNYTTITGTFKDGSGAPLAGNVTFTPNQTVYASGIPVATPGAPVVAEIAGGQLLNANGGALALLATDNAGLTFGSGTGFFFWTVSLQFGQVTDTWSFFLPSSPPTVDLYSLKSTPAASLPLTTLGDTLYENATPTPARLPGNTTTTRMFLRQAGTGSASAAPAWDTLVSGDIPANAANTSGTAAKATNLAGGATLPAYLAPHVVTLTFTGGGTTLVDASLGNAFNLTLTASTTTLGNPSNAVDGEVIRFRITQGSGGSFTLAYGTAYDFGAAGAPVLSTAAAKVDILGFEYAASISKWCYLGSGLGF